VDTFSLGDTAESIKYLSTELGAVQLEVQAQMMKITTMNHLLHHHHHHHRRRRRRRRHRHQTMALL
jgi:hypothetical protein